MMASAVIVLNILADADLMTPTLGPVNKTSVVMMIVVGGDWLVKWWRRPWFQGVDWSTWENERLVRQEKGS